MFQAMKFLFPLECVEENLKINSGLDKNLKALPCSEALENPFED